MPEPRPCWGPRSFLRSDAVQPPSDLRRLLLDRAASLPGWGLGGRPLPQPMGPEALGLPGKQRSQTKATARARARGPRQPLQARRCGPRWGTRRAGRACGGRGCASRGDGATRLRLPVLPKRDSGAPVQPLNPAPGWAVWLTAPRSGVANWEPSGQRGPHACLWGPRRVVKGYSKSPGRRAPQFPSAATATWGCRAAGTTQVFPWESCTDRGH